MTVKTMNNWTEILNAITSLLTALATLGMLTVAWLALRTWRREFVGTKKIELARQIMECVYGVQDAVIYARLNMSDAKEIKEVEEWLNSEKDRDPEHTMIYPDRFRFMIPHHRLEKQQNRIDEFKSLANKATLYWDKEIFRLFYEIGQCILQIRTAAKDLYYNDTHKNPNDLIRIIFFTGADDQISQHVNDIVEEFRINLEPIYKDQRTSWKQLKKIGDKIRYEL